MVVDEFSSYSSSSREVNSSKSEDDSTEIVLPASRLCRYESWTTNKTAGVDEALPQMTLEALLSLFILFIYLLFIFFLLLLFSCALFCGVWFPFAFVVLVTDHRRKWALPEVCGEDQQHQRVSWATVLGAASGSEEKSWQNSRVCSVILIEGG